MRKLILQFLIAINLIAYISFYIKVSEPIVHFTFVSIFLSILYIIIVLIIKKSDIKQNQIISLIAIGIFFRIILFPIGPIASDDVYRYLWDGKVQANGINPYTYAPTDEALKHLHSELLPAKVNFQHLKTIYPPFSQWMFLIAYLIAGESVLGIKLLLLISEFLTIVLIFLSLKNFKINEKYSLIYALSPLPILQFFIDAHLDGFGITLLALFLYFISKNKLLYAYFTLGFSIAAKLITIMIYPFLLKGRSIRNFLSVIIVPIVTVALLYLPYSINGFPFESLFIFAQKWYSNGAIFTLFQKIFSDNFIARLISLSLFFVSFVWLYFSEKSFKEKIYQIFVLFFIFSPVVHPWYLSWVALLTALNFRWSGVVFISTISIANIYAMNYILLNKWEMSNWFLLLEYLPVIVLLLIEEFHRKPFNHELYSHQDQSF
uniref:Uncharacterized protein n=1 Tax=Ignavibacterium album TaxID=591197 RepID=A0A832G0X4_9BACT